MNLYCKEPFYNIEISHNGDVYLCCKTWHPVSIGNILENSLEEIWLGEKAIEVRNSIIDQTYKHCLLDVCPAWISKTIPTDEVINEKYPGWWSGISRTQYRLPVVIKFSFDASCNLQCPSCRSSKFQIYEGTPRYDKSLAILNQIKKAYLSTPNDSTFLFTITGSGDAIGSHLFRNFLLELDGSQFPNMGINLLTNGVMLTEKVIGQLHKIHKNLKEITISVDAATEYTYNKVRKGGDFTQLKKNIDYINNCSELSHCGLMYTYVVQATNYKEIRQFQNWITSYPRSRIRFTRILNWVGSQEDGFFERENIWDPKHPEYDKFFKYINEPWVKHGRVSWTNIESTNEVIANTKKFIPIRPLVTK